MKDNAKGMTLIVKTITRLTVGLILLYGIFTVLKGHISPGGGFAGGVIIALSLIHIILAFGRDEVMERLDEAKALFLTSIGAGAFLFICLMCFLGARTLKGLDNPCAVRAIWCDIAISVMVGGGLFLMFLVLVLLVREREKR